MGSRAVKITVELAESEYLRLERAVAGGGTAPLAGRITAVEVRQGDGLLSMQLRPGAVDALHGVVADNEAGEGTRPAIRVWVRENGEP